MAKLASDNPTQSLELARVLVVDDDPASRLTLQTLLEAGGYAVESAASAAEAVGKLDEHEFALVLSDLQMESPEAGYKVIAHAKRMDYKPATALIQSYSEPVRGSTKPILIEPEDVPGLLTRVAGLIARRATKRVEREMKLAAS